MGASVQLFVKLFCILPLTHVAWSSPDRRQNSKYMSIWDAVPDRQFRSGRTIALTRSERQIQPLSCVSKTGEETGVCMFAWNCVEAGGKHLGTCIDRFYFGSCCKLPEANLDNPEKESDNEIIDSVTLSTTKKTTSATTTTQATTTTTSTTPSTTTTASTSTTTTVTSTSTTTTTTTTTITTTTTKTTTITTSTTTASTSTTLTTSTTTLSTTKPSTTTVSTNPTTPATSTTKASNTTTTASTTILTTETESPSESSTDNEIEVVAVTEPVEEPQANTSDDNEGDEVQSEASTELSESVTNASVAESTSDGDEEFSVKLPDSDKPNEDIWVPVILGPDGSPQIAPGFGDIKPVGNQMYNCTEVGEGLFNCTIVSGPCKGDSLVTSDAMAIKNHIEGGADVCHDGLQEKPIVVDTSQPVTPDQPTGDTADTTGGVDKPVVFEDDDVVTVDAPEPGTAEAVTQPPTEPEVTKSAEDDPDESVTFPPMDLSSMTYQDICGSTPWLNKTQSKTPRRQGRRIHGSNGGVSDKFWSQFSRKYGRQGKIVNGHRAEYGEWPWQVSLRQWRTATFLHKCGAALLSDTWAITAAHCVESVNPDELLLRMGEFDLNDEFSEPFSYQDRKVQIVASHPKFDPKTFEYDLALLRFYEPVTFQPNIVPICVPDSDEDLVGETAWVTGWGRLYEDGPLPAVLQEVDLPIITNDECELMYEKAGFREHIPHIFICAGYKEGGKDSCEGDSGGPMSVQRKDGRFMLGGVISWGIGCAEKNQPGVYTRISEFRDWVNQILQY